MLQYFICGLYKVQKTLSNVWSGTSDIAYNCQLNKSMKVYLVITISIIQWMQHWMQAWGKWFMLQLILKTTVTLVNILFMGPSKLYRNKVWHYCIIHDFKFMVCALNNHVSLWENKMCNLINKIQFNLSHSHRQDYTLCCQVLCDIYTCTDVHLCLLFIGWHHYSNLIWGNIS